MPDDPERSEIEREFGDRYQIVRVLGRGAFGAVYLARERQLHRLVAIKALHAERAWSEEERARLLREARTVANLSHPAIVPLIAFGETASIVYMVMPYVGGETLAERLRGEGRFSATEVRRILIEIADTLAYAHGEGVLHRDIKPENILLERAGAVDDDAPPRVRLIDFGVAAFPGRDAGMNASSETWGTPHFMAPEQALGEPELDPRSELYSVGVLGYLLLGGRLPFNAASPTERLTQQRAGPRIPLSVCAPGAPADLVAAIERCLAYEPEARWRKARDLRDALVRGAPAVGTDATPIALVRQRLRTRRRPAATARPTRRLATASPFAGLDTDVRFALRTLRKTPAFTAATILILAIGLGATTVIFSAVHALVLRPLPVADPSAVVMLQERRDGPNETSDNGVSTFTYWRYLAYREPAADAFSGLAAQEMRSLSLRLGDQARPITGLITSGNYFEVLGLRPALGRFYTGAQDDPGGAEPVVVVSHEFWKNALGENGNALGSTLFIDSRPLTVIGVAPPGFHGAFGDLFPADAWVPVASYIGPPPTTSGATARRLGPWMIVFGRLRPGIDVARASAVLRVTSPRVAAEDPRTRVVDAWVEPVTRVVGGELGKAFSRFMMMLLAVAGAVLLIAATNTAGMLLARAAARRKEVATRLAVGATRGRLVRQLLVESLLLCVTAGAIGLLLTWWLSRLLNAWRSPFPWEMAPGFAANGAVLGVTSAIVLGTGLVAGLIPALQETDLNLAAAMKEGGL